MSDCIFCKIVKGEIPSLKVLEDDDTLAFLDILPVNPGHTLIVPKQHYADFMETPDDIVVRLFGTAKKVAAAAMKVTGAPGFNIGVNTGSVAGQLIFHTHVHIMPRFEDDDLHHWPKRPSPQDEMKGIAEKMRAALM